MFGHRDLEVVLGFLVGKGPAQREQISASGIAFLVVL